MRRIRIILCLSMLLTAMTGRSFAQGGATGTVLGTVTDSTGAIVPNVKITVTNTQTGVAFQTVTSSAGDFNAPGLNPGSYKVTAEAKGFQKAASAAFTLTVNQHARIDVSLKPGAVTETVQATAQAVQLDTDTAELSNLVSQQQVEDLPLNGRNFMQLLLVGAGAVTVGGEQGTMRQGQGNAISVNGGRPEGNNYTLDGLVNTDAALITPAVVLSQDAIQEFKVSSGTYSADQGFSATQINIVSKAGTNNLHGSVFWFDRNDAFDANPFPTANDYISGTPTAKPVLRQNQFGFVAGGPIYIPKVYDGRNKSFFMANYEGWRITNGARQVTSMPNPAILTGDFSAETYQAPSGSGLPGGPLPAYGTSDCSKLLALGGNCMPVNPATGLPFQGNIIPSALQTGQVGAVAVKNGFWQAPTIANQPEGAVNYIKNVGFPLHQNQQTYRGDQYLGKFGSVFFRYSDAYYTNQG
ncbi:MAG TPA: carboxypeptidase-like regulatory domain-containing protein, partial [Patescibacteria group bacterium]|nr:carboxypeptidase-like regulatory domain-containing protein [Patescibacteria group bacterium]